jgi:hypothetical protein
MRRAGRKVFGAAWHHDPLAPGRLGQQLGRAGRAGRPAVCAAPVGLSADPCPSVAARAHPGAAGPGRRPPQGGLRPPRHPPRRPDLRRRPAPAGTAPPPRTHGRPRTRGDRLPELTTLAGMVTTPFALHRVTATATTVSPRSPALPACGRRCSAPARSTWYWCARPTRPTGSTRPWSPPTLPPSQPSWCTATRPGGRWRPASARPARTPAWARPATGSAWRWSAPSPRAGLLQPGDRLVRPARPPPRRGCHPPRAGAVVPDHGHLVSGRHARQAPPSAHRRPISAKSALCPTIAEILEVQAAWAAAEA